jgi:hypothetical protein
MFKVVSNQYVLTDDIIQQMHEQIHVILKEHGDTYIVFDDDESSVSIRIDRIVGRVTNAKLLDDGLYIDVVPLNATFGDSFRNMLTENPSIKFNPCLIGNIAPNQDKPPYHFNFQHLMNFIPNITGTSND